MNTLTEHEQHEQWLANRKKGIGGSDAACILGLNPWKTNVQLWEEKTGRKEAPDISDKAVVQYGKEAEKQLRELFALDFPQYAVGYDEFGMLSQPERPWLFATLDGELTEVISKEPYVYKRKGVLEIKTTEIMRSTQWAEWSGEVPIPQHYYIQVLHQLLATGYDFAILKAQIKYHKNGQMRLATQHTWIERKDVQGDLDYLLSKETEFWQCVQQDRQPNLILPSI